MQFEPIIARENWHEQAAKFGYLTKVLDDPPYWMEALPNDPFCAVFSKEEEQAIRTASKELTELALEAVEYVCNGNRSDELFTMLSIPEEYRQAVRHSWNQKDSSIYGRFDFSYNNGELKVLELQFDTALTVFECSILQRYWLEDLKKAKRLPETATQFNSLHADLVKTMAKLVHGKDDLFHFTSWRGAPEDEGNTRYLESCAVQAGHKTAFVHIQDIDYDAEGRMIDQYKRPVKRLYKLYPWEYFVDDDLAMTRKYGHSKMLPILLQSQTQFFEPLWKIVAASKGILPILWELNPNCRYLLPSFFEDSPGGEQLSRLAHCRKPIYSREGFSISIIYPDKPEMNISNPGPYENFGFIVQELHPLPEHNGYHVVIGSWVIDGKPAGIGLRADRNKITTAENSLFVPHYVLPTT